MLLKLMLVEEGKKEELTKGKLIDIVNYLKENKNIYNWVPDEDKSIELPELEEIETLRELKVELKKIDMSWWSLEIEEIGKGEDKMLKELLKNEGLNFSHEWKFDGKTHNAEFEVQIEKGTEKEVQVSIDQIKGRNAAVCLFNEEYDLNEDENFIQDLESQNLEFVIEKLEEIISNKELSLDNGIHFVDLENPTAAEKEKINEYWEAITSFMDVEDMEVANDITNVDTTDTIDDKVQYLKDYLSIAKDNLILG